MPERAAPLEIALSAAWNAGQFGSDLVSVDGVPLKIIHRGIWSHGLGPDFRDALILFAGRELRAGSVEIHLRGRGWTDHGHHLDPAYNDVVLHVVSRHDGAPTRRNDGALVPTVEMGPLDGLELPELAGWDWDRVGGQVCASGLAAGNPHHLRELLYQLGDVRLAARSARIEARLDAEPPGAILWQEILDGLGYSANREPMRLLASLVALDALESMLQSVIAGDRVATARGVLLGVAGFLPLSPSEAHLGHLSPEEVSQVERFWRDRGAAWADQIVPPSAWIRARVRPANHPVPRLLAAASLLATSIDRGGLVSTIVALVRDGGELISSFRDLTKAGNSAGVGTDRALDIVASSVIPLALALATHTGDQALIEAASLHWEALPAPSPNALARRAAAQVAGSTPLGRIGARGSQGLIHLDTVLCQPRRCFECPIAAAELSVKG